MAEKSIEQYLSVLNKEQREAVEHEGSPLLILAGAGSGKTRVITTKIAYLISCKDVNPYSILSVTFTKKAANEMRERAINMEALAEKSQIRTFHSFGSWFLRKYYLEAGLEQSFTVYDDDDMAILLRKAVPALTQKEAKLAAHQIALAKDYCLGPKDDLALIASEFDLPDIYAKYEEHQNTSAALYAGSVNQDVFSMRARGYDSSLHAALYGNKVPLTVYHNLIDCIHKNLDTLHDYYSLRKKALGLKELRHYDVYVPLVKSVETRTTYEE